MSSTLHVEAKILSGASQSNEIDVTDRVLLGVYMPAAWDAAKITFLASSKATADGGVYGPVENAAGTEYELTAPAAGDRIWLDPLVTAAARYIKIRSGTAGAAVNQTADRTVILALGEQGSH